MSVRQRRVVRAETGADGAWRDLAYRLLGAAWLTLFAVLFYAQVLWANGLLIPRLSVLLDLPGLLLANFQRTPEANWLNLQQRIDLLACAGVVVGLGWYFGRYCMLRLQPDDRCERAAISLGTGLSVWSLLVLGLGTQPLSGWMRLILVAIAAVIAAVLPRYSGRMSMRPESRPAASELRAIRPEYGRWLKRVIVAACAPFVIAILLGAFLPATDFDVKEYHLQGPKEYWLAGRIQFLPHNVYTSFPFLTEMLSLSAMAIRGDWLRGAWAGQAVLMSYSVIAALGVFAVTRRLGGDRAAWLAVLIWLTSPWTFRISTIAYTEGALATYLILTVLAFAITQDSPRELKVDARLITESSPLSVAWMARRPTVWTKGYPVYLGWIGWTGFLAGSAAACKYPGVLSAVIPFGIAIAWVACRCPGTMPRWKGLACDLLTYGAGVLIAFAPWLLKNLIETGNPVYPLLWSLFGGESFDATTNERWNAAHAAPTHLWSQPGLILPDLWRQLQEITLRSDWQSVLIGGFAPLSLLAWRQSRGVRWLWLYVVWLLLTWCWLTHRIDRFWVPMLPLLSVLAGIGLQALWAPLGQDAPHDRAPDGHPLAAFGLLGTRALAAAIVVVSVLFNLAFITTGLAGFNGFLLDEAVAQDQALTSSIRLCRAAGVDEVSKVLFIGEAAVFDADFPCVYNTVFDDSWFEAWCAAPQAGRPKSEWGLRSADEFRRTFAEQGVTHICVHWKEVLRYRLPGSYGFTDFVHPARFDTLVAAGVLQPIEPVAVDDWQRAYAVWKSLSPTERVEVERWAPELRIQSRGADVMRAIEVYRVVRE